jgi:hypothetical protein
MRQTQKPLEPILLIQRILDDSRVIIAPAQDCHNRDHQDVGEEMPGVLRTRIMGVNFIEHAIASRAMGAAATQERPAG